MTDPGNGSKGPTAVVVTRSGLGTLNHTALSDGFLEALAIGGPAADDR